MKKKSIFSVITSFVVLVTMSFASCNGGNKQTKELDSIPDALAGVVGVEKFETKLYAIPADAADLFGPESYHLHDYGFFYNNFKQNIADRINAFLGN